MMSASHLCGSAVLVGVVLRTGGCFKCCVGAWEDEIAFAGCLNKGCLGGFDVAGADERSAWWLKVKVDGVYVARTLDRDSVSMSVDRGDVWLVLSCTCDHDTVLRYRIFRSKINPES